MRIAPMLAIALAAAACAKEPAQDVAAAPQSVVITATDYGFELPSAPVQAGLTALTLVNNGQEIHHITLFQLADGKTVDDFMSAIANPGPPPAWAVAMGGPNGAPPGGQANATLVLEQGSYVLVCFIPSPDGVPHLAKGMVMGLEVEPAAGPVAALPAGDIQVALMDYSFALSRTPAAGPNTFTISNQGQEGHELVLVRLTPGATLEEVVAWIEGGEQGPPPGIPVGGVSGMNPGQVQNFTATLEPGSYGLLCFIPAPDGAPHFAHGMAATFTVS